MSSVLLRLLFPQENVPQMPVAILAYDFSPTTVHVGHPRNRIWQLIVKAGPPAPAVELVLRSIQRRVTTSTDKGPSLIRVVIFAGERLLGSLVDNDFCFFGIERIKRIGVLVHG